VTGLTQRQRHAGEPGAVLHRPQLDNHRLERGIARRRQNIASDPVRADLGRNGRGAAHREERRPVHHDTGALHTLDGLALLRGDRNGGCEAEQEGGRQKTK
jgi:hypothetical protein